MPYYKFGQNDIFNNTIEAHPKCEFLIHDRKIYFNKYNSEPSSHSSEPSTTSVRHVPSGYISLYEINIDRKESEHGGIVSPTLAYQFTTKEGGGAGFKTVSSTTYSQSSYGDVFTGSYPLSASLSVERYVTLGENVDYCDVFPAASGSSRPRMTALKNTLNHYKPLSSYYDFSYYDDDREVTLVSIPSIFYGSAIEKGSVSLKYYITGSLAGELQDIKRNGELVQVSGIEEHNGKVAGVVLYNEGFMALTGSWTLDEDTSERYNWCPDADNSAGQCDDPRWKYWGQLGDPDEEPANDLSPYTAHDALALFHFNDDVVDETGNITATAHNLEKYSPSGGGDSYVDSGAGQAPASGFGKAAAFNGGTNANGTGFFGTTSYVKLSDLGIGTSDFTIEFWMNPTPKTITAPPSLQHHTILCSSGQHPEFYLNDYYGDWNLELIDSSWSSPSSPRRIDIDTHLNSPSAYKHQIQWEYDWDQGWQHVAVVREEQPEYQGTSYAQYRLYVDGVEITPTGGSQKNPTDLNAYGFSGGGQSIGDSGALKAIAKLDFPNSTITSTEYLIITSTDGTAVTYTAHTSEDLPNNKFKANGTEKETIVSFANCINSEYGHNGKIDAFEFYNTSSPTWLLLTQTEGGTNGNRAFTGNIAQADLKINSVGWTSGTSTFRYGTDSGGTPWFVGTRVGFSTNYTYINDWKYRGELDELLFTKSVKYDSNFTPPSAPYSATTADTEVCLSSNVPYSSFDLSFNGTNYIPTVTMLAHAKRGELNHSNNPTFLTKGQSSGMIYGTGSLYAEDSELAIKNTVKSLYDGHDASFQKQTWISQIGIYDDDKNLIAIAKLANPVRKTEDREFTFKLKLDF